MFHKKILSTIVPLLFTLIPCSAGAISDWWAEVMAPKLTIDFSLKISDGKPLASEENYFRWKDSSGDSAKDGLDAVTGASTSASTRRFDSVRFLSTTDTKPAIPDSLRGLFLYSVTSQDFINKDNFNLISEGGKHVIQFQHRGNAYKIVSDEKGFLNFTAPQTNQIETNITETPPTKDENVGTKENEESASEKGDEKSVAENTTREEKQTDLDSLKNTDKDKTSFEGHFFVAKSIAAQNADGTFAISEQFKGKDSPINWESLPYEAELKELTDSFYYKGKLTISFDGTYLKVKGKLKKIVKNSK